MSSSGKCVFDFQPIFLASMIVAQNVSEVSLPFKRRKHYIGPSLRQLNGKKQTNKQINNDFLICIMQLLGVIF